jgi:hypothetical protein
MKKILEVTRLAFLSTLAAAMLLTGCGTAPTTAQGTYIYEYVVQLLAMPSCSAKVEAIAPCYARLSTEDGRVLIVGSPGASWEVVSFVQTLQKGKTYFLPEAFMEYQKKQQEGPNKADPGDRK